MPVLFAKPGRQVFSLRGPYVNNESFGESVQAHSKLFWLHKYHFQTLLAGSIPMIFLRSAVSLKN